MDIKKGIMFALLAALISGVSVFVNASAVKLADPFAYTVIKNLGSLVFIVSSVFLIKERKSVILLPTSQIFSLILIGIIGGSIPFVMFFYGLSLGGASVSSFIYRSLFIFAAVFGYLLLKEKPSSNDLIAGFAILLGNALLISGSLSFGIGQLLVLGATILWALEYTISRKVMTDVSPKIVMLFRMFFGSIILVPFLLLTNSSSISSISIPVLGWLVITSLLLFGFMHFWYNSLKNLPVLKAAIILSLGGLISASLDILFAHKNFSFYEALGLLLTLGGVIFSISLSNLVSLLRTIINAKSSE